MSLLCAKLGLGQLREMSKMILVLDRWRSLEQSINNPPRELLFSIQSNID